MEYLPLFLLYRESVIPSQGGRPSWHLVHDFKLQYIYINEFGTL